MPITIPSGTELHVAAADQLPLAKTGIVRWRDHKTTTELSFEKADDQNAGCWFFIEGAWLIRVGKGQVRNG